MVRRDSLQNEADYLPATVEDLVDLRRRIVDAGHTAQVASGIVGWLVAKAAGDPDPTTSTTRSSYRKILASLEPAPERDPEPDRRRLVPVGADGSKRHVRRKGGKALVAVVLAGAASLGVGARPKAAEAASAAPGPVSEQPTLDEPPRILVRRRSVKPGRRGWRRAA